ncbi:MAG: hypothetical protein WAL59_13115 [Roseiarcus sp.]
MDFLDAHPFDLAVIATHERKGLAHWLDASVEQKALRKTGGRHGLVGALRGSVTARIFDGAHWPLLAVPLS